MHIGIVLVQKSAGDVVQLRYGLYSEVQDDVRGDGRAGLLQRRGEGGEDRAYRVGFK